jgi:protein CMS1
VYLLSVLACLHLDYLKYVILDWSHRDVKLRRLIDIPETRTDTMELLRKHLIPYVRNVTDTKLVLY